MRHQGSNKKKDIPRVQYNTAITMNYGLSVINFASFYQPSLLAEMAVEAEATGWGGIPTH